MTNYTVRSKKSLYQTVKKLANDIVTEQQAGSGLNGRRLLCKRKKLLMMLRLHGNPSVTASPCHLPLHKGGFYCRTQGSLV